MCENLVFFINLTWCLTKCLKYILCSCNLVLIVLSHLSHVHHSKNLYTLDLDFLNQKAIYNFWKHYTLTIWSFENMENEYVFSIDFKGEENLWGGKWDHHESENHTLNAIWILLVVKISIFPTYSTVWYSVTWA